MINSFEFKNHKLLYGLVISAYILLITISTYIPDRYYYFFFGLVFFATLCFIIKSGVKIDLIPIFLMVRSLAMIINGYVIGVPFMDVYQYELVTFLSVSVYIFAVNFSSSDKKEIRCILTAITLFIAFQLFESILRNGFDKNSIGAVVGMSNYAAAFLLLGITYLLFTKKDLFEKCVMVFAILVFALVQSMGAIMAFAVIIVIYAVKYFNWKKKSTYIFLFGGVALICAIVGVMLLTGIGSSITDKIAVKFSALFSGDLNTFGSSRISLYEFCWENIMQKPWFGNVLNTNSNYPIDYRWQAFRTHNFFFESMRLYGVFGTLINAIIVAIAIKRFGKSFKNNQFNYAFLMVMLAAVIHGLVEPTFFTMDFSCVIWLIVGAMLSPQNKKLVYKDFKQYNPLFRSVF